MVFWAKLFHFEYVTPQQYTLYYMKKIFNNSIYKERKKENGRAKHTHQIPPSTAKCGLL